jgi:hypothetical protein
MPRIKPIPDEQASPDMRAAFERHVSDYQARITNMKATLGHSRLAFDVYMQWYPLYEQVKKILGERLAYLYAHAISAGSNCPLCTTFFRRIIIEQGENPDELIISPSEQEILDLGSEMARNQGQIPAELYQRVANRFTDPEMVVLIAFAGQMIATNVFNNALEVEIDDYLIPYTRTALNRPGNE